MATGGRRGGSHDGDEDDRNKEHERHKHSDRRGKDVPVFMKVRGKRWLGSAPPTAQAYANALAQWRRLPGAIGVTSTDLGGPVETPTRPNNGDGGGNTP